MVDVFSDGAMLRLPSLIEIPAQRYLAYLEEITKVSARVYLAQLGEPVAVKLHTILASARLVASCERRHSASATIALYCTLACK